MSKAAAEALIKAATRDLKKTYPTLPPSSFRAHLLSSYKNQLRDRIAKDPLLQQVASQVRPFLRKSHVLADKLQALADNRPFLERNVYPKLKEACKDRELRVLMMAVGLLGEAEVRVDLRQQQQSAELLAIQRIYRILVNGPRRAAHWDELIVTFV